MIVSEANVHDALAYLAIDPHPIALARKDADGNDLIITGTFASMKIATEYKQHLVREGWRVE